MSQIATILKSYFRNKKYQLCYLRYNTEKVE